MATRSTPDFAYDSQKELYAARKNFAMITGYLFDPSLERAAITVMTKEQAIEVLASLKEHMAKYEFEQKKKKVRKGKKPSTGDEDPRGSSDLKDKASSEHEDDEKASEKGDKETPENLQNSVRSKQKDSKSGDPDDSDDSGDPSDSDNSSS